jgi:hypothetical protein
MRCSGARVEEGRRSTGRQQAGGRVAGGFTGTTNPPRRARGWARARQLSRSGLAFVYSRPKAASPPQPARRSSPIAVAGGNHNLTIARTEAIHQIAAHEARRELRPREEPRRARVWLPIGLGAVLGARCSRCSSGRAPPSITSACGRTASLVEPRNWRAAPFLCSVR